MSQSPRDAAFLREVVLGTTGPVLTVDGSGEVAFASDAIEDVLGCEPEAVVGETVTELLVDGKQALDRIREAIDPATGTGTLAVSLRAVGDRTVTTDLFVAATERDGDRFLTLTLDPVDTCRADRPSAGTGRSIQRLFEHSGDPLFVFDAGEGTLVDGNQQAAELLGASPGTLPARSVREFVEAPAVFVSFLEDVVGAEERRHEEFTWQTGGGDHRPIQVVASPIGSDSDRLVFARARDVGDRNQLQTQRRRRTAALEAVHEGVAILDSAFEYTYVNGTYAGLFGGGQRDDLCGEPIDGHLPEDRFEREIQPAVERDGTWQGSITSHTGTGSGSRIDAAFEELEDGSIVVVARGPQGTSPDEPSAGSHTRRGDRLTALEAARRKLSAADDREAVANACVGTLSTLGYELGCLRFEEDNALDPAATTPAAAELVSEHPGFELGLSDAGRAYRTGEPVVRERGRETAAADLLATSVHVPVGDHGVLTVATTGDRAVPQARPGAIGLLAASAEVALDRLELERRLRTRQPIEPGPDGRPDGERRTQELIGEVVAADSRSEIQKLVCTGLERADAYSGAWTAAVDATGERLCLTERAGVDEDRLAPIDDASLSAVGDGAVETAIETGEVAVLDRSALFERAGRQHERTGAAAAVALAPLAHGDKVFGILAVHAPDPDAFGPANRQRLAVLGDTISFVLSALENERLLLSDEFVQLEFQVTDPDCLSVALSDELDTAVSMKRTVQNADDEHLSYVRIEDASPEAARAAARSIDSVHDCRVVTDYDYGCLLEVTRSSSGAEVMMEFGATMRTAEAESGRGRLVLEAPHSVDVRRIVQAYQSYNPESELLSKRRVDRPVRAADQLRADVEDDLTEKQLSAVSAAYFSGYYEWPRESTAEEVADSMEISASTLHQHLRHAHQKLLSSILETSFSRRL
jgi:PAS domain S-box-containing protein